MCIRIHPEKPKGEGSRRGRPSKGREGDGREGGLLALGGSNSSRAKFQKIPIFLIVNYGNQCGSCDFLVVCVFVCVCV